MTRDRNRKRRVRDRAAKTGESYTAALRHLRNQPENPMETTTTTTTVRTCLLCGDADDPAKPLLTGGNGLACIRCDEDVRSVLRRHLEPVAAQGRYNVDMLMSLVLYKRSDGRAEIHLLTPKPGQVIGARGATATAIRDDLLPLSKVLPLRLNLVEFEPDLEPKAAAEA